MSFNLRPGTSLFGNITFTPGTNENYVAPPIHGTISTSSTSLTYYAVSSDASDDNATNEGSVFIFNSSDGSLVKELNVAGIDLQRSQDRFGFELESYGTKIFIRSWGDDEAGSNVGAVFVFDADDLDADPVKLIPSPVVDPVNGGEFGTSIAVSDDKLFIGDSGSWDNYAGMVYVYDLSDLTAEPTTLTIGGGKDLFGKSLAISSGKLFVGAKGVNTVYVYDLSDLTAAPQSFTDPTLSNFGFELASNSSTVFVHSRHDAGFISVYDATDLSYITKLTISDGSYFGWDIAATEDYLCTGSLFMNKAFVYDLSDLTASPVELTVSGSSQLGYSANAKDNTFIVGANEAAYVYDLTDLNAAPLVLTNDDGATGEFFGFYTALVYATSSESESSPEPAPSPTKLVISVNGGGDVYFYDIDNLSGTPDYIDPPQSTSNDQWLYTATSDYNGTMVLGDIHINTAGEIFIYDVSGSTPVLQHQLTPFDGSSGDYYSFDIAVNDRFIAVGSPRDDDDGSFSGSVYVYDRNDLTAQPIKLTAENAESGDRFGRSVAFTTDKLFVGAYVTDEGATDTGSIYVYDIDDFSAQAIELVPPNPSYRKFTGYSMDSIGDTVVVGSYGVQDGSVYVYDATNLSSDPVHLTENLSGKRYGEYVSISQTHIAVSAGRHNDHEGAVFVYDRSDLSASPVEVTAPQSDLNALQSYQNMEFGQGGVDLSENKLAVGSVFSGVYVYDIDNLSSPSITLLKDTVSTRLVKFI